MLRNFITKITGSNSAASILPEQQIDNVEAFNSLKKIKEDAIKTCLDSIPNIFTCAITQELITDPILTPNCDFYQRPALEEWMHTNANQNESFTCPITRNVLTKKDLYTHEYLTRYIDNFWFEHEYISTSINKARNEEEVNKLVESYYARLEIFEKNLLLFQNKSKEFNTARNKIIQNFIPEIFQCSVTKKNLHVPVMSSEGVFFNLPSMQDNQQDTSDLIEHPKLTQLTKLFFEKFDEYKKKTLAIKYSDEAKEQLEKLQHLFELNVKSVLTERLEEFQADVRNYSQLKSDAVVEIDQAPEILTCYSSGNFLDTPLISTAGNFFDRSSFRRDRHGEFLICPTTQQRLDLRTFVSSPTLNHAARDFFGKRTLAKLEINSVPYGDNYQAAIDNVVNKFKEEINPLVIALNRLRDEFKEIYRIKNELKLDLHNEEHLKFWHDKCGLKLFGGGAHLEHITSAHFYQVPTGIKRMMVAASQHFETVEGFVNAVKEARGTQRKNIFSFFARSDATKELYQAPDLKTFKFN